jgi:signal transduction histidine kinase
MAKQKILLVDDKPENLFAMEKIVSETGAEVITAASGNDALIASLNHEFSLAVLDVQMPEMDGYELAECLRSDEKTRFLPIIFLSAVHSDEYHIFKGYEAGAVDFITKPFDRRMFLGKIYNFLQIERLRGERSRYLRRMEGLVRISAKILAESTAEGLLNYVADAARELIGARIGVSGRGYSKGDFRVTASSMPVDAAQCQSLELFSISGRGVLELFREKRSIRLTESELREHSALLGLPQGHALPGGLLGASLQTECSFDGMIMVFDRIGGDFSEEDETLLVELSTIASLGLRHIEARDGLRQSRDELERRVQERTRELECRNKDLQDFIFVASHDLREPLRKIRTFGDLLSSKWRESLAYEGADLVNRMQNAAKRMNRLLDSLLALSRLTTRAEAFKETDLKRSVEAALSNLEILIKEKNARIEVGDLPTIQADRVQMIQLFQNLIGNALKFQDGEGHPHIRIFADPSHEGRVWEISVEDNGIGFDEQYLDKIFLPFQRLHGRGEYGGVGMGLAICKKITERHGGELKAKSAPGKGAVFVVTLPAVNDR